MTPSSAQVRGPAGALFTARRSVVRPALAAALVAAAVLGLIAIEAGAASSASAAADEAASLRRAGSFPQAIALYRSIAALGGPLYLLAGGSITAAAGDALATQLMWGTAVGREGNIDQAAGILDEITAPQYVAQARRERATLLIAAARAAAMKGDDARALQLIARITTATAPPDLIAEAGALRPQFEVGHAAAALAAGDAAGALADLDDALSTLRPGDPAIATANTLLPNVLLAAARQRITNQDFTGAADLLTQLVAVAPASPAGRQAATLLAAPVPVSGTLVHRDGSPFSTQLRLGTHFAQIGSSYTSEGPYYLARSDSDGNFTFPAVAVGATYLLEVFEGGTWTTLIDPATNGPQNSFTPQPIVPRILAFIVVPG